MGKERRAYVVLVLISLLLSVATFTLSVKQVHQSDQKWCALLNGLTSQPVPKPTDPKANPSRERSYQFYMILLDLSKSLGCRE